MLVVSKLAIACVLFVCFSYSECYAPGVDIECLPLKSCPTVLKLVLTKKQTPEIEEFLKHSYCGYDIDQPKVWCSRLDFCVTPEGINGTCTSLKKCKPFLQLALASDTSVPTVEDFLNKFHCNKILEEEYVCCQNEKYEDLSRPERGQPNFYEDYGYYDWPADEKFEYPSYQGNFGAWSSHHKAPIGGHEHGVWDRGNFQSNHDDNNYGIHKIQPPGYEVYHSVSNNNNKRGTSREEGYGNHEVVSDRHWNHFEDNTFKTTSTRYEVTTSGYENMGRHYDQNDRTTEKITNPHMSSRGNKEKTNNRGIGNPSNNAVKVTTTTSSPQRKNLTTKKRTNTPSSRRTTSSQDRSEVGGGGDIIFEDDFEDLKRKKSTSTTTERNSRTGSRQETKKPRKNGRSCETPDRKPGVCTDPNSCQPYMTLQRNLDKSKQSVMEHLNKFKCDSEEICCEEGVDNGIDNALFSAERTNEHVPAAVSTICGRQTASTDRIVGGRRANIGEFPWLALLMYPNNSGLQLGCGGSLINSRYVVTAAHCVDEQVLRQKGLGQVRQIVLGEFDTRNKTDCIYTNLGKDCADPAKTFRVESIISHEEYTFRTARHDIALIRLDQEVTFTDYIKPICLPTNKSTLLGNETFIIAGWGRTSTETSSSVLRKAKIPYVDKDRCWRKNRALIEGQFCAGFGNGTDSCSGDSGGPVMLEVNFNFEFVTHLVGIVSYGFGITCGTAPSVNTFVPYYIDWMNKNMK